jgi:hypothetical protein
LTPARRWEPGEAFDIEVLDVERVVGFRAPAAAVGPRSATFRGRSVRFTALRTGRFVSRAGLAIAPVTPLGTASRLAPAVARGTGLPADFAACATVLTAARIVPLTADAARPSALSAFPVDRALRTGAVPVGFRFRGIDAPAPRLGCVATRSVCAS